MTYHGSPYDSIANAITRKLKKIEFRKKARENGVRKKIIKDPVSYADACAFNKEHNIIPNKRRIRHSGFQRQSRKPVSLPKIEFGNE